VRYQKIHTKIWTDEKFVNLSRKAQFLFLYILTSPHSNALGAYVLPKAYICEDISYSLEQLQEPFKELLDKQLILYDESVKLIIIKNHLKHNTLENENQTKFVVKILASLPHSPLLSNLLEPLNKPFHKHLIEQLQEHIKEQYSNPINYTYTDTDTNTNTFVSNDKIVFDSRRGEFKNIQDELLEKWKETYPAIKVTQEIKKAEAWYLANPKKKRKNIDRFLVNWFNRAEEKAPRVPSSYCEPPEPPEETIIEQPEPDYPKCWRCKCAGSHIMPYWEAQLGDHKRIVCNSCVDKLRDQDDCKIINQIKIEAVV